MNNIKKFMEYMKEHQIINNKEKKITHTTMNPPGKYNIEDKEYEEFIKLYSKVLFRKLSIIERPKENGVLLIDIDMRFKEKERQYKKEDINKIIEAINKVLMRYYKMKLKHTLSFVFEKSKPTHDEKNNEYKDGFHIIYPYLITNKEMRYMIIEEAKKIIKEEKSYEHLECVNDFDKDVFDTSIVEANGIMMYGSRKPKGSYYKLSYVRDIKGKEYDKEKYDEEMMIRLTSNRKPENEENIVRYKKEKEEERKKKVEETLERLGKKKKKKERKEDTKEEQKGEEHQSLEEEGDYMEIIRNRPKKVDKEEEKMAKKLVGIMSKKRASNYEEWIAVGWALHNVSDKLLNAFKKFSMKCKEKYDEGYCEEIWRRAKNEGYTIASLHLWAKEDNNEEYKKILRENLSETIKRAESGLPGHLAKLFYNLWKYEYKCVSQEKNVWYEFQEHRWVQIEQGYTMKLKIIEYIDKEFSKLCTYYLQSGEQEEEVDEREKRMNNAKRVMKIISNAANPDFIEKIMKCCKLLFYDKKFIEILDSKEHLIGFNDGVYDLNEGRFRKGSPDDYITMTVGYNYPVRYDINHPEVRWVEEFFGKVMVDKSMNKYIKILLASFLEGYTRTEQFLIWTGSGSNGKSKTVEFFQYAFGEYCAVLSSSALTQKRKKSSDANPDIARLPGKRFVILQEPEDDDKINVGFMKELTGADKLTARKLYGDIFEYTPQFSMLLTCNKLPEIPSQDNGTWRRLRVSPWESEFVSVKNGQYNGKDIKEYKTKFAKDRKLNEKLKKNSQALLWLLINVYYPIYKKEDYDITRFEPEKVLQETNEYQKNNDILHEYMEEDIIKGEEKDKISISELYAAFKTWIRDSHTGMKIPSRKIVKAYIEKNKKKYKYKKNYIYGFKFADDEESDDESDGEI